MPDEKIKTRKADKDKVIKRLKGLSDAEYADMWMEGQRPPTEIYRPDEYGHFVNPQGKEFEPVDQIERNQKYLELLDQYIPGYIKKREKEQEQEQERTQDYDKLQITPQTAEERVYQYGSYNGRPQVPSSPKEIAAAQVLQEQLKRMPEPPPKLVQSRMAIPEVMTMPDPNAPVIQWPQSGPIPAPPPASVNYQGPLSLEQIKELVKKAKSGMIKT